MAAASFIGLHFVNPVFAKSSPRLTVYKLRRFLSSSPPCTQRSLILSASITTPITPEIEQIVEDAREGETESFPSFADADASVADGGRLYVGNLPYSIASSQLREIFREAGRVVAAEVVCDRTTERRSRGFGFVTMASVEEATVAIRIFNGSQLGGRTMKVNFPEVPRGGERAVMGPRIWSSRRAFVDTPYKIYAGNLPWTLTSEGLRAAFEAQPGLMGAKVVYERESGRSRGFGFVSFQTPDAAEEAVAAMNGAELEGRPLRLNLANEKITQGSAEVVDGYDDA